MTFLLTMYAPKVATDRQNSYSLNHGLLYANARDRLFDSNVPALGQSEQWRGTATLI